MGYGIGFGLPTHYAAPSIAQQYKGHRIEHWDEFNSQCTEFLQRIDEMPETAGKSAIAIDHNGVKSATFGFVHYSRFPLTRILLDERQGQNPSMINLVPHLQAQFYPVEAYTKKFSPLQL
jgi:hypothetical protein